MLSHATMQHTHNYRPRLPRAITSSTFPEATAWLKALCHFHHERVSIQTTNFSLSISAPFGQTHSFFRAGHEYFRAEWQIQWRMKREKEKLGWGGMSREVWVITLGFADLINDLSPADFNQTTLVFIIDFHLRLLSLHFPLPLLLVQYLTSLWWTKKKKRNVCGDCSKKFTVSQWVCVGGTRDKQRFSSSLLSRSSCIISKLGSAFPNFLWQVKACKIELNQSA